ncbi:MAG: hypothetical protein RL664_1401, partial [Bacteroidota bacterium]
MKGLGLSQDLFYFHQVNTTSFFDYLTSEKRSSVHTVSAYRSDIGQFEEFMLLQFEIAEITSVNSTHVRSWISELMFQEISERSYRSHFDNDTTNAINVKFLLNDCDEKHWGQLLAKNERKRKRDYEVQEIFAAFRMVAVELISRIQTYRMPSIKPENMSTTETLVQLQVLEEFIKNVLVEIDELIIMINNALKQISINYSYTVPNISTGTYYSIKHKNFSDE